MMDQVGGADETGEKKLINIQQGSLFCKEIFNFRSMERDFFFLSDHKFLSLYVATDY